jgi:hypothetical protein
MAISVVSTEGREARAEFTPRYSRGAPVETTESLYAMALVLPGG